MATYGKNISSKVIIRKVMRDLRPTTFDWIDDAVEWIGEALEHIGANAQLRQKQCVLHIEDHKALLPKDLYYINQVAVNGAVRSAIKDELKELTEKVNEYKVNIEGFNTTLNEQLDKSVTKHTGPDGQTLYSTPLTSYETIELREQRRSNILQLNEINSRIIVLEGMFFNVGSDSTNSLFQPLSYGASTFPSSIHCDNCINENTTSKDSYIIDHEYLKTSFPTGTVCLSYMAFPVDDECYPLVPDSISYKEAMFWYVYRQMLLGNYDQPSNKIDYQFADQKWKYYCSQARNESVFPDIDRMESFMNQWVRLIPDINRHELFFEELNTREDINRSY